MFWPFPKHIDIYQHQLSLCPLILISVTHSAKTHIFILLHSVPNFLWNIANFSSDLHDFVKWTAFSKEDKKICLIYYFWQWQLAAALKQLKIAYNVWHRESIQDNSNSSWSQIWNMSNGSTTDSGYRQECANDFTLEPDEFTFIKNPSKLDC